MADNQSQPVTDQTIPPVDSSTLTPPVQVPTPDLSDQSEASSSAHRPEPPILADEKESTESASLDQSQTSEEQRPDSPKLANETKKEVLEESNSTEIQKQEIPELADNQGEATASAQTENIVVAEEKPVETVPEKIDPIVDLSAETLVKEEVLSKDDADIKPPDNQASQVQSSSSDNASNINTEQNSTSSAEIKPEPLESPKEAPLADEKLSENNQKSFGELLHQENKPEIQPQTSESVKPFSFGDLIKETHDDRANIPEDLFEIKDNPQETVQQTQLAPQQPNPPPQVQQQTDSSNQTNPTPPPPQVIEKVIEKIVEKPVEVIKEVVKEVPVVNQEEVDKQIQDRLLREQTDRRNLANRVKAERVAASLDKILSFASNNSKFNNLDIRDLLHVSQSTATTYLSQLVNNGRLKKEGKSKYTKYSLL